MLCRARLRPTLLRSFSGRASLTRRTGRFGDATYPPGQSTSTSSAPFARSVSCTLRPAKPKAPVSPNLLPRRKASFASAQRTDIIHEAQRRSVGRAPEVLESSVSAFALAASVAAASLLYYLLRQSPVEYAAEDDIAYTFEEMSTEIPPGRPGNLTPEQEEKLRLLWTRIFQICAVGSDDTGAEDAPEPLESVKSDLGKAEKEKKKRRSIFSRKNKKDSNGSGKLTPVASATVTPVKEADDDKYGQTKLFFDAIADQSPESIRATIWSMVKHDHPDALVLRFLRARKWDVEKALIMLVSTMHWRAKEMHVDDDIMLNGEAAAVEAENGSDPKAKKLGHDFMAQIRMGKSFLHGVDKAGRPICVVRVRLHHQGEQAEESLERYTVYIIETARMLLRSPVDTATIIFDMSGFSMANMDYTPVKFMIKCFEANYPECLGAVLVHKAPWIFQGIWKIIRGWLDPVVAGKVHFTNNAKDVEEFIPPSQILKELDGQEDWEYQYVEPLPGENDVMKDTSTREKLLAARELLCREYEEATLDWIQISEGEQGQAIKARRDEIARRLRDDYWKVDPYVRARSLYDRTRVIQPGGKLDYYPGPASVVMREVLEEIVEEVLELRIEETPKVNGTTETSPDDVD